MTFEQVVAECLDNRELVAEFDRLNHTNISRRGTPLELQIDDASGKTEDDVRKFIEFVMECVWNRLPKEAREVEG